MYKPFSFAYCSHLVKGLGLGTGFSLGKAYDGGGRQATTASSTRSVGSSQMELNKIWKKSTSY